MPIDSTFATFDLTIDSFCRRTGYSPGTVRAWREGRRIASIKTVLFLEKKLKIHRHFWRPDLWPEAPANAPPTPAVIPSTRRRQRAA
jgi:hypothetical protein